MGMSASSMSSSSSVASGDAVAVAPASFSGRPGDSVAPSEAAKAVEVDATEKWERKMRSLFRAFFSNFFPSMLCTKSSKSRASLPLLDMASSTARCKTRITPGILLRLAVLKASSTLAPCKISSAATSRWLPMQAFIKAVVPSLLETHGDTPCCNRS